MNIASIFKTFGDKAKRVRLDVCPIGGGRIRLTLSPEPASGAGRSAFVPLQADGTPEEVDADLDKALPEYFSKCAGRQTNLDQIERQIKSVEEKAEADRKAKFERKPSGAKAPASQQPQTSLAEKYGTLGKKPEPPPEPDLFGSAAPQQPMGKKAHDEGTNTGITVDPESVDESNEGDDIDENAA